MIPHWIDGELVAGTSGRCHDVYDPARGEVTASVAFASSSEVDRVVTAAKLAQESWRDVSLVRRAQMMFTYREVLSRNRNRLAQVVTAEHGKVLADAEAEVDRGMEVVDFACGIPHLLKGDFSENVSTDVDVHSMRQPVGVVVGITPFNFPVMIPLWMYPIAIACGSAFILKPSEKDPSASLILAELMSEAGFPNGIFNVVQGDASTVETLLEHPDVQAVSSVGSTRVARRIYEKASRGGKRVQALGGAKNHLVVLPDADIGLAADAVVGAAFGSTGQRCMSISAVVAVGTAGNALADAITERVQRLRVGPGTSPNAQMGPLVTQDARTRVLSAVEQAVREGAKLVHDGRRVAIPGHDDGFFLGPCFFDAVTAAMAVYKEEVFGPVLVMLRTESLEAAIELINSNPFGNGCALFTSDGAAARTFQREVHVGMVGINVPIPVPMAFYSFGGWNDSLFGDSHMHGVEGVEFFTRGKVVTSRWGTTAVGSPSLDFPRSTDAVFAELASAQEGPPAGP